MGHGAYKDHAREPLSLRDAVSCLSESLGSLIDNVLNANEPSAGRTLAEQGENPQFNMLQRGFQP